MHVFKGLHSLYQPIVELDSGAVVAYEALARGPTGAALEMPDALFAAAIASGRLDELDWCCRAAAISGALDRLDPDRFLFINVEPATLGTPCPQELRAVWERGGQELSVVLEVTERALTDRPADLLRMLAEVRELGWGIALDDVGADIRSLALMPLVRPDVVKLDLRLVQQRPDTEIAAIVAAVNAERERTGALILAEGIETPAHLRVARAMGAVVGQGWLFGRPEPLPSPQPPAARMELRPVSNGRARLEGGTPFDVVGRHREVRHGDKDLLLAITRQLEGWVPALGGAAVVLSAFQAAERLTLATGRRYEAFARRAALVGVFGVGMDPEPVPGVRGAALRPDDPLRGEWSVIVLGPHQAGALVAVDLGDDGPDHARRFDFALTYDRDLVIDTANVLLARVAPVPAPR